MDDHLFRNHISSTRAILRGSVFLSLVCAYIFALSLFKGAIYGAPIFRRAVAKCRAKLVTRSIEILMRRVRRSFKVSSSCPVRDYAFIFLRPFPETATVAPRVYLARVPRARTPLHASTCQLSPQIPLVIAARLPIWWNKSYVIVINALPLHHRAQRHKVSRTHIHIQHLSVSRV